MNKYKIIKSNDLKFNYNIEFNHKAIEFTNNDFNINDFVENKTIESYENSNLINLDFNENISTNDKWDYTISILSGIIAAGIDIFYVKEFSLEESAKWGKKEVSDFVISFAKMNGYKGKDLTDAIRVLEKKFVLPSDKLTAEFGGGLQHHLRDFVHHPTPLGLFFSILSQFTYKGFGTDKDGNFIIRDIPKATFEAKTFEEKIFNGVVIWLFHLISDMAGSSSSLMGGTGIPGILLSTLKEISALPIIKEIKVKYQDDDIALSKFIAKLFNGTYFKSDTKNDYIRFDLRTEIGIVKEISKQTIPVIINECIVRGFFTIGRFWTEIKSKEIKKFSDLQKVNYLNFLPFKNRDLNRMLTIASGTFTVIDASHAFVYSAIKNGTNNTSFFKDFFINVNIAGIVRFTLTCKIEIESFCTKQALKSSIKNNSIPELKEMTLDRNKTMILYSLELLKCNLDIASTKNKISKDIKTSWVKAWTNTIINSLHETEEFFVSDKSELKNLINKELERISDKSWMDIISLELSVFIPYYPLNCEDDPKYQKQKYNFKSFDKILSSIQNYETLKDIQKIYRQYKKNNDILSGKTKKQVISITGVAVATVVIGGLAFYFAPQIATLLVGGSFVGLHGAALTSASLAMLGGGALSVGGLGMAGGTMIIAGGGAILGLTASGLTNNATTLLFSNSDYTLRECSKLLTITKYTILDKYLRIEIANELSNQLLNRIQNLENSFEDIPNDFENRKEVIRGIKKSIKYLKKTHAELKKAISNKKSITKSTE